MSNYIDVDILRAEIKRKKPKLRKICGQDCKMTTTQVGKLFDGILSFVDSNSEPGVDLENELKKYFWNFTKYSTKSLHSLKVVAASKYKCHICLNYPGYLKNSKDLLSTSFTVGNYKFHRHAIQCSSYLEKEEKAKARDNILFIFSVFYSRTIWLRLQEAERDNPIWSTS